MAVVWSGSARPLQVLPGVSVFNLMGGTMKSHLLNPVEPVYVVAPKMTPAELGSLLQ